MQGNLVDDLMAFCDHFESNDNATNDYTLFIETRSIPRRVGWLVSRLVS